MKNPKEEIREYLKKLINRLLYVKGLNKQLKLLKEWETPNRIKALEIGSYFFRLVGFSFHRTLLIELCLLLDEREDRCIVDWLQKAKEHASSIEPTTFNQSSFKREILSIDKFKQIIIEQEDGSVDVSAIDALNMMRQINNPALNDIAEQVGERLQKVIDEL